MSAIPDDFVDTIETMEGHLRSMVKRGNEPQTLKVSVAAPAVSVAAPVVTIQAPSAGPVTVNVPAAPKQWKVKITKRDRQDRIEEFMMTAS